MPVKLPDPVTGELVTVKMEGNINPTEDTEPDPVPGVCHDGAPVTIVNTCPFPPGAGNLAST